MNRSTPCGVQCAGLRFLHHASPITHHSSFLHSQLIDNQAAGTMKKRPAGMSEIVAVLKPSGNHESHLDSSHLRRRPPRDAHLHTLPEGRRICAKAARPVLQMSALRTSLSGKENL